MQALETTLFFLNFRFMQYGKILTLVSYTVFLYKRVDENLLSIQSLSDYFDLAYCKNRRGAGALLGMALYCFPYHLSAFKGM